MTVSGPVPESGEPPVIPPVLARPLCCPVCDCELVVPYGIALECELCALIWPSDQLHKPGKFTYPGEPLCGKSGCIRPVDHPAGECAAIPTGDRSVAPDGAAS